MASFRLKDSPSVGPAMARSRNVMVYDPDARDEHAKMLRQLLKNQNLGTALEAVLASLALPGSAPTVRLGSQFGSVKTAVSKPQYIQAVSFPTSGVGDLPQTDILAFKFNDILRAFVTSVGLTPTQYVHYQSISSVSLVTDAQIYPRMAPFIRITAGGSAPFLDASNLYGPLLYFVRNGTADQNRGFLLSTGFALVVTFLALPPGSTLEVTLNKFDGSTWFSYQTAGATDLAPSVTFNITSTDYYSLSFTSTSAAATGNQNVKVDIYGNGGGTITSPVGMAWGQFTSPTFENVVNAVNSYRVNGSSLMYTNTSSPLYRQGQVVMRQLPTRSNWIDFNSIDLLNTEQDSGIIQAVDGAYLFHKPVSAEEFSLTRTFYPDPSIPVYQQDFVTEILPISGPILIGARVTDPNGRSGYWTPSASIEFETLSQWFETEQVHLASDQLEKALVALTALPQYHTNDFHLSDIWDGIKSFASDVWSGIKEVVPIVAPLIGPLLSKPKAKGNATPGSSSGAKLLPVLPAKMPKKQANVSFPRPLPAAAPKLTVRVSSPKASASKAAKK